MIERDGDDFHVSCDGCSDYLTVFDETWSGMVTHVKAEGWRMRRDKAEGWEHHCPSCVADEHKVASDQDGGGMPDEAW